MIIATFTHVQAPYTVHGDEAPGAAEMRDVARFHFGFVVPYQAHGDAGAVIAAVAASRGDLGLVPVASAGSAWWRALEGPAAPKIIARLPFVERAGHPAALPVYVVSKPIDEAAAVADMRLFSVPEAAAMPGPGRSVVASAEGSALLAVEAEADGAPLPAGAVAIGGHAAPFNHVS